MLNHRAWIVIACAACGSSTATDAGVDGAADGDICSIPATDASFSCDVSSVPPADLACDTWVGDATIDDAGGASCPAAFGWDTGGGRGMCIYTWTKNGTPDLCALPSSDNGSSALAWLEPACGTGCEKSLDGAAPTPCASSNDCAPSEYCEQHGNCASAGTCALVLSGGAPGQVCGCDDMTYPSAHFAHQSRVSVAYLGACE